LHVLASSGGSGYDSADDSEVSPLGGGSGGGGADPKVPATQTVPELWPVVPVLAVNKHPVFPKFIKVNSHR